MGEMVKKLILAGAGFALLTMEKVKETFEELVKRGEMSEQEAREVLEELKTKAQSAKDEWETHIEQAVNAIITRLNIPSRRDLEALKERLDKLEEHLKQKTDAPEQS